jgi:hypothetical protein
MEQSSHRTNVGLLGATTVTILYVTWQKNHRAQLGSISPCVQLWQLSWNQWDNHNDIDKNTLHREKQAQLEILSDRICTEYNLGPANMLNYDRQFFCHPLSTTLQKKDETHKRQ